jgi:hypothetical protein
MTLRQTCEGFARRSDLCLDPELGSADTED